MIFALLLFGCADDGSQCQELPTAAKHYEAKLLCEADAQQALQSEVALKADYPTVEARCTPVSATVAWSSGDPDEGQPAAVIRVAMAQPAPRQAQ